MGSIVAAPVFEETFFRGFLLPGFRHSAVGTPGAIVITSLSWTALHVQYDAYSLVTLFVLGIVLGLARVLTGSVYTTIGMHAVNNLIATLETALLSGGASYAS